MLGDHVGVIGRPSKKGLSSEQLLLKRRRIFSAIAKKEIPKVIHGYSSLTQPPLKNILMWFQAHKIKQNLRKDQLAVLKKLAKESQREARKKAIQSQKMAREAVTRARRLSREMMAYWKRYEMKY